MMSSWFDLVGPQSDFKNLKPLNFWVFINSPDFKIIFSITQYITFACKKLVLSKKKKKKKIGIRIRHERVMVGTWNIAAVLHIECTVQPTHKTTKLFFW